MGESVGTEKDGSVAGSVKSTKSNLRGRSASAKGLPSDEVAQALEKVRRKKMRKHQKLGHKGETDRWQPDWKPKHLFSGKRGIGKTDRR